MTRRLKFSAFDTLFFREARPMESVGAKPLEGRFPPTARTVAGALRTVTGEAMNVDWDEYLSGDASQQAVRDIIGAADGDGIGALELRGAYPMLKDERLYPVPLHLLGNGAHSVRLQPGNPVNCDLGWVYLPEKPESTKYDVNLQGAKPLENCWLTGSCLAHVLSGRQPEHVFGQEDLFKAEARLGIAMNHQQRTAEEGKLYQTVHARTQNDVSVGVDVTGIPETLKFEAVLRLGGEARFAHVATAQMQALPVADQPKDARGLLLMICTAADFAGDWLPTGFVPATDAQGVTVWQGEIANVALTIQCAVLGKAQREGGWDMKRHQSRPAVCLMPAGSVYFCKIEGDLQQAARQLNGTKIGYETALGRGELAVGYW